MLRPPRFDVSRPRPASDPSGSEPVSPLSNAAVLTTVNETFGDFAVGEPLEYMAFNRSYEIDSEGKLLDATTYIDPQIFNKVFANSTLDAKNFWVQVGFDVIGRRVKSAREIPNL